MKKVLLSYVLASSLCIATFAQKMIVLPYTVNIQGNIPKNISEEKLKEIKNSKSLFYQNEMIANLMQRKNRFSNRKLKLQIMTQAEVNKNLANKGYSSIEASTLSTSQLQQIFPDCKIVRGEIIEYIIRPIEEAQIINMGASIFRNTTGVYVPNVISQFIPIVNIK